MSAPESPAEALRRAASLVRERAQAATPGPWRPVAGLWQAQTFAAVKAETWLMATGRGAVSQEADADYAAFMHPLVGLALAGLLEAFASCGCDEDGDHWAEKSAALKVARLVLGEPEAEGAAGVPDAEPDDGEFELAAVMAAHPGATFPELARAVLAEFRVERREGHRG